MPDPNTPSWVNHLAMQVESEADLVAYCDVMVANGIKVVEPTHRHFIRSICFFDPNEIRLELTALLPVPEYVAQKRASANADLDSCTGDKKDGLRPGANGASRAHRTRHGSA